MKLLIALLFVACQLTLSSQEDPLVSKFQELKTLQDSLASRIRELTTLHDSLASEIQEYEMIKKKELNLLVVPKQSTPEEINAL